jgi:hypothetical protein
MFVNLFEFDLHESLFPLINSPPFTKGGKGDPFPLFMDGYQIMGSCGETL